MRRTGASARINEAKTNYMENSNIEWCDHTFNPWEGCTKVSPGCANCYAEARNKRWNGGTAPNWGKGALRRRTSKTNWAEPMKWDRAAAKRRVSSNICEALQLRRPRVFCASVADWLDDEVDPWWRADLLDLVWKCQNIDWLLLTKRPELWRELVTKALLCTPLEYDVPFADWLQEWLNGSAPYNVWAGTTVEDQPRADERRDALKAIPARIHFVSHEPSLEVVDWNGWEFAHWLVSGGESGPNARPSHPNAHRALRDFCRKHERAYLFKQWGEWLPDDQRDYRINISDPHTWGLISRSGQSRIAIKSGEVIGSLTHEAGEIGTLRVGKKAAGRLLDGVEHNEFPEVKL